MADVSYEDLAVDSPIGAVRALIPDTDRLLDPGNPTAPASYLFSDKTIERYLYLARGGNPRRAAALACEALAGSDMLILKKMTEEDLSTDGPALAKEWGAKASRLNKEADADDSDADDGSISGFLGSAPDCPVSFDPQRRGAGWWD